MFGLLNIHKPAGITSRDAVNRVQRVVRPDGVGHAGTLDPLATGVLVACIGPATRLIEYVQKMPKTYLGTFLLGQSSPTEDTEGEVTPLVNPPVPTLAQIEQAFPQFLGTIWQRPPIFSALKVNGKRAYDLARQGQTPELAPRQVEIHGLELVQYDYPQLQLRIHCGSGTYVRSLGRDLAAALGTAGVMSALVREAIGPFTLAQAVHFDELTDLSSVQNNLQPPLAALAGLPILELTPTEHTELSHGRRIVNRWPQMGLVGAPHGSFAAEMAACYPLGTLAAIVRPVENSLQPVRFFPSGKPAGEN